ncbi:MAG: AsmA-like C-terminal region-containing protein, partial [Pseudomonadota bacterium]
VPFDGLYTMPLTAGSNGRASVEGWIELSERFMTEFNIGLPPGSVGGAGRGNVTLDLERDTAPTFSLTSDLAGLSLALVPLDWSINEAQTGDLSVAGTLGQPPSVDRLSIDAGGLRANGSVTLTPDGQLQQANFSRVRLGNWIDAPVDLVGLGAGKTPLIRVAGGTVDLRQTSLTKKQGRGQTGGGPVSLRLDTLQIIDTIALTDFNAELNTARGVAGDFTAKINGRTPIAGRIIPQAGGSAFQITSQDAGGVLASANLLKQARDGDMELILVPGEGDGVYEGQITATRLRVKDLPVLAALLNGISLIGILDQLNGDGIHFSDVNGRFQLAPDRVTIYEVAAVGASMGISMEGYYHSDRKLLDLDGVISPVYALNLGGWFGRPGEGLIGFGYDVEGPANNPKVQVDPLSVLTPGMFRDLFRGPPPARPGAATRDDTSTDVPSNQNAGEQTDR